MNPADADGREHCQQRQHEGQRQQRHVLRVGLHRLDPGPDAVLAVAEPVPQTPQDLGRLGRPGHRLDRLAVLQDVEPVAGLGGQPRHPPQRSGEGEQDRPTAEQQGGPQPDFPAGPHRERDPQDRCDQGVDQRGGVGRPDAGDDQGEQRGMAPPRDSRALVAFGAAQAANHDRDQPGEAGPRQQDGRDAGHVLDDVGGEHVNERRGHAGAYQAAGAYRAAPPADAAAPAQRPQQEQHAEPGQEQQGARPQPLRHPVRGTPGDRRASTRAPAATGSRCSGA